MTKNKFCNMVYGGQSTEEFNSIVCDWQNINTDSNDEASELIVSTTPFINTWHLHDVQKTEQLTFPITICDKDGEYIDAEKERCLKKWLMKNRMDWLSFDQDDLYDTFYKCVFINPVKNSVGKMTGSITFTAVCDSGTAWTGLRTRSYSCVDNSSFTFVLSSDYQEYELYPIIKITPTENGNISIINNTTNKTLTINNCVTTETITIECDRNRIYSSNNRVILDDWNKVYFSLVEGKNNVALTGNFVMRIEYRLPIRVGG